MKADSLKHFWAAIVIATVVPAYAGGADCAVTDRSALLALDIAAFDQRQGNGWRVLQDKGCFAEAADLIDEYSQLHGRTPVLAFHAGQLRLKADDYPAAKRQFLLSKRSNLEPDNLLKWNEFVDAYLAFIDNDRERLQKARDAIASGVDFWGNRANLSVVDMMLKNLGTPYKEAITAR